MPEAEAEAPNNVEEESDVPEPVTSELVYSMPNPDSEKVGNVLVVAKKDGKEARVFYDYGDSLADMTELFGEAVVFSNARGKMIIGLQAAMRSRLKAGQDIGKLIESYKPGVAMEKIPTDMNKATEDYFSGLSEEEQDAMITRLMAQKG